VPAGSPEIFCVRSSIRALAYHRGFFAHNAPNQVCNRTAIVPARIHAA
jgi:hypothetical protein